MFLATGLWLASAQAQKGEQEEKKIPSGVVAIDQVQVAFLGSGNFGGGTLREGLMLSLGADGIVINMD